MKETILIPIDQIVITDRVRKADSPEVKDHIDNLISSLQRFGGHPKGLLQPVLLDENNVLQAGWCRYSAAKASGWPSIPVHYREKLSVLEYEEIELEENFRRLGFTWQEEVAQVVRIHRNRAKAWALEGKTWTQQMTGDLLGGYSDSYVSNCLRVHEKLTSPTEAVRKQYNECGGLTDAVRIWYKEKEDAAMVELKRRTSLRPAIVPVLEKTTEPCIACNGTGKSSKGGQCFPCQGTGFKLTLQERARQTATPESDLLMADLMAPTDRAKVKEEVVDLSQTLFLGDSVREVLPVWPDALVDHIFTDPPYGIDMEMLQQASHALQDTSRVADTHQVAENLQLFEVMLPQFYRVMREGGYLVLWCDIMNWQRLYDLAEGAGFGVQRWPLVWHKISPCKNQMAHVNTTKDFEIAMVCRKGAARLPKPVTTSHIQAANDAEKASNPFAKPYEVWQFIYNTFSIPGQVVLEPFAGEGSGVLAGLRLNRKVLAIEKDKTHYPYLVENVKKYWEGVFPVVRFV